MEQENKIMLFKTNDFVKTKKEAIEYKRLNINKIVYIGVVKENTNKINHKYEIVEGIRKPFVSRKIY